MGYDCLELLLTVAVTVDKSSPIHPGVLPHIRPALYVCAATKGVVFGRSVGSCCCAVLVYKRVMFSREEIEIETINVFIVSILNE